jgi:alkaline phosphatase D
MTPLTRRRFLVSALSAGVVSVPAPAVRASGVAVFATNPFTLGVASGHPLPTGVVLWTRLAPTPSMPSGGVPPEPIRVAWEVATEARMEHVVRHGVAVTRPESAHALHVEVDGLQPGRWYWYRFHVGSHASVVGRTRTAPMPDAMPERLRFSFLSCQCWEDGFFNAYRPVVADGQDLLVFLGDYIYERPGRGGVRQLDLPEAITLDDYRVRHALYKLDPDLQAAHAACPWIATWDDHEVSNDYADDRPAVAAGAGTFAARRAAAYQAYYEHMPIARHLAPSGPHASLYHTVGFGALARFHVLDTRQFRSPHACALPERGHSRWVEGCAERLEVRRTMLGAAQERWVERSLADSSARWNIIAQQTLMAQLDAKPGGGQLFRTGGWDGYPAARRRLLESIARTNARNPVVVGGDVHSFWVADLKLDFNDPHAPTVATEFVGTSVTSPFGRSQADIEAALPDNPHVRLADGARRGYVRVDLTPRRLRADLRTVRTVRERDAESDTLASFTVEDGRPGPVRV